MECLLIRAEANQVNRLYRRLILPVTPIDTIDPGVTYDPWLIWLTNDGSWKTKTWKGWEKRREPIAKMRHLIKTICLCKQKVLNSINSIQQYFSSDIFSIIEHGLSLSFSGQYILRAGQKNVSWGVEKRFFVHCVIKFAKHSSWGINRAVKINIFSHWIVSVLRSLRRKCRLQYRLHGWLLCMWLSSCLFHVDSDLYN